MTSLARFVCLALVVLVCASTLRAQTFHIKERLDEKPGAAKVDNPDGLSVVAGRLDKQKAVQLTGARATWAVPDTDGELFVEFWMKPVGWDAYTEGPVEVAAFRFGGSEVMLRKGGAATLELVVGGKAVQAYPIYNWTAQPWMKKGGRDMWHYVMLGVTRAGLTLTVDGFAARQLARAEVPGKLQSLVLAGPEQATAFSWLHVVEGAVPAAGSLRTRYRALYNGKPDLHTNTVTVPKLDRAPTIDGTFNPDEWARCAKVVGFTSRVKRALREEDIHAYLGYDDRYLYLAIRTPYKGVLRARQWDRYDAPLWGEESYEMFFHPPYTGVPDFVQLVGNPYGAQSDLRMLNLAWDGKWDWKTTVREDEWIAEMRIDFEGTGLANPGDAAVWTMNLISTFADAQWHWTQRYNDPAAFGVMRLEKGAQVVRPGRIEADGKTVSVPLEVLGASTATLTAGLEVYGPGDVLPSKQTSQQVEVKAGQSTRAHLVLDVADVPKGQLVIFVRQGDTELYYHAVNYPAVPMVERKGYDAGKPREGASAAKPADDQPTAEQTPAEKAYARTWTAEELGRELLDQAKWQGNTLGISDKVPAPWTPMAVDGQSVSCWGRKYVYSDTLLPSQIVTQGTDLLSAPGRFELTAGDRTIVFEKAEVAIEKVNDGMVRVRSTSRVDPYRVQLVTEYEFDGMGKIDVTVDCPDDPSVMDRFEMVLPMKTGLMQLYHVTSSTGGHHPLSTSEALPKRRFALDLFREILWVGDRFKGLCWFAESLEGWPLKSEDDIQVLEADAGGTRLLRVKLGDRPTRLERPLKLTVGLQATPMRPRRADSRKFADPRSFHWQWFWGDGSYYPFQSGDNVARAREQIDKARAAGKEVMPCSSVRFFGTVRFARNQFGPVDNPGLYHREHLIWNPLWSHTTLPMELPKVPERHTAQGDWYDKRWEPRGLKSNCPASPHQDYYIWKLNELIEQTGLGAIYLDQPFSGCANVLHGCGYIDYAGRLRPKGALFATRRMIRRIYTLFMEKHGKTMIKWHCSNQIVPPIYSFIDVFWDGENYGSGPHKVFEFYSTVMTPERCQAEHTGLQYGFIPDLLPEYETRYAPSPASIRDLMGTFMIHNGTVFYSHNAHPKLVLHIQKNWINEPLETMKLVYYWQRDPRVAVADEAVKANLHYREDRGVLVLFNWSDRTVSTQVTLDATALGMKLEGKLTDLLTGKPVQGAPAGFTIELVPRDVRVIRVE